MVLNSPLKKKVLAWTKQISSQVEFAVQSSISLNQRLLFSELAIDARIQFQRQTSTCWHPHLGGFMKMFRWPLCLLGTLSILSRKLQSNLALAVLNVLMLFPVMARKKVPLEGNLSQWFWDKMDRALIWAICVSADHSGSPEKTTEIRSLNCCAK